MPVIPPVKPEEAPENIEKIYQRIRDTIGDGEVPTAFQQRGHVEAFLQDSYMNHKSVLSADDKTLSRAAREALALATSSAMGCSSCVKAHAQECEEAGWSSQQVAEILSVTATCAMYNVYYKFRDLSGDESFKGFSGKLRAHTFQKTSLEPWLVELINVVVSNIMGCPMCTAGHTKKALELELTREQVDEAIKVSAVMASFNVFHRTQ